MASFINRLLGRNKAAAGKGMKSEGEKIGIDWADKQKILHPYIQKNNDMVYRVFRLKGDQQRQAAVVYLEGRVDTQIIDEDLLKPLMQEEDNTRPRTYDILVDQIGAGSVAISRIKKVFYASEMIQAIFDGYVVLIFEGVSEALVMDIGGGKRRSLEEPPTERTLRGSREGFIEDLTVNIALIRQRLRDPNLVVEKMIVGKRTRTEVALLYIEDIADPEIVNNTRSKIKKINIDGIGAIGYIEQFISDNHLSPFPQFKPSERPDKVTMELLEGRVVIMANGTPTALMVPSLFVSFLQASEDYYDRPVVASFNRIFRYLAFALAISLPPLYISLLSFQPELVPVQLFVILAQARQQVPFPIIVEVLIQEIIIQLVIETGLRMPAAVGQTVGVVAGIVLGQAAISAKLASPGIIIIVAVTTIATFALPNYTMVLATRVIRMMFILATATMGLFGFSVGWFILIIHLIGLESMGVPYFAPFAPTRYGDLKDSVVKGFIWHGKYRPQSVPQLDRQRQGK
ncbi:spore germination protein [Syntrophomonas erecta subsp. sporosyntropha]